MMIVCYNHAMIDSNSPNPHALKEQIPPRLRFLLWIITGVNQMVDLLLNMPSETQSLQDVAQYFQNALNLGVKVSGQEVPDSWPLMVAANHPYPIQDALALIIALSEKRKWPMKILADFPPELCPEIAEHIIYAWNSFKKDENKREILKEMMEEINNLFEQNGTLIIFPAGQSSYRAIGSDIIQDIEWYNWLLTIAKRLRIPILPAYIGARTAFWFNFLRNLFSRQFVRFLNLSQAIRKNETIEVCFGEVFSVETKKTIHQIQDYIYKILGNVPFETRKS